MGMMELERQPPPEATAAGSGSAAQRLPLLIIVIGVLLLATLIPHIFNASTLLFSPSPSTVCLPFLCTLYTYIYTRLRYGSLHLRSRKQIDTKHHEAHHRYTSSFSRLRLRIARFEGRQACQGKVSKDVKILWWEYVHVNVVVNVHVRWSRTAHHSNSMRRVIY